MTAIELEADVFAREHTVTALEDFVATEEPGADPLLGNGSDALIPEGGDVMVYGDGGAGKTTLTIDCALHLAAGAATWLDIPITRAARVLLVENEGPRALFRAKLRRKHAAWQGPPLDGRLTVLEHPWGELTFTEPAWCDTLAGTIRDGEVDVLIAGPVTRLGMDEAGTLQQVRDFMRLVADVRAKSGRRLTVILVHHESKSGAVSGAWEGAGDTLLHVEARGHGHTRVNVQKARWSSAHHGTHLDLAWADGEAFTVANKADRDYAAEIEQLLTDGNWRTVHEVAAKGDATHPGIGANLGKVKETLKARPDLFAERTGEDAVAVGRHANATVYGLNPSAGSDGSDSDPSRCAEGRLNSEPPLEGSEVSDTHHTHLLDLYPPAGSDGADAGHSDHEARAFIDGEARS